MVMRGAQRSMEKYGAPTSMWRGLLEVTRKGKWHLRVRGEGTPRRIEISKGTHGCLKGGRGNRRRKKKGARMCGKGSTGLVCRFVYGGRGAWWCGDGGMAVW